MRPECICVLMDHSDKDSGRIIIKTAPKYRLQNERDVLERVRGHTCIRPLLDTIDEPTSLVLRYLDDNLLDASSSRKLETGEIKFIARRILEALSSLHELGFVHTGSPPFLCCVHCHACDVSI